MTHRENLTDERCPDCNKGTLVLTLIDESFDFDLGDRRIKVSASKVPVKRCLDCGEEFVGPEAVRVRHEAVCVAAGYLTPADYKSVREEFGWSQQYLADLTGYGVATVSRAERGKQLPNLNYDIALRSIRDCRACRENLERQYRIRTGTEDNSTESGQIAGEEFTERLTVVGRVQTKYGALDPVKDRDVFARQKKFKLHPKRNRIAG